MKTIEELKTFYSSTLMGDLSILEKERLKVARKIKLCWTVIIIVVGAIVAAIVASNNAHDSAGPLVFVIFGGIAAGSALSVYFSRGYSSEFKDKVIAKIIHFIDANLKYKKSESIDLSTYKASGIFPNHVDRYHGDDLVEGQIGKTAITFSEMHTEYKTETTNSKGHRQTHWHTIFKGLFFIGDFNKDFKGRTLVLPDAAEKLFGNLGSLFQSWNKGRGELVKLEDPEFEKMFVVYGSDQIEARYILSTSLMKRIVDFKKKSGKNIYLSFVASKVYVALSYTKNLFEPKVFSTLLDFQPIQEYFEDLQMVIGIVEDLNLNTRLWTK
jgi:hypothetical protein